MALFVVLVRLALQLLFGDRSPGNITSHILSSLSLAGWVLAFGVLNLVVDFKKLFSKSPTLFRNFTSALSITLALVPAMTATAFRVRNAARLRTHRRGFQLVRSIAVPVLSSAIDQALNLADSMEARSTTQNPVSEINLRNISFNYEADKPILNSIDFKAEPGSITVVHGNTGCGKSTLLKVLHSKTPGSAMVGQFPRDTFVADTVFDELAFAPRQQDKTSDEIRTLVGKLVTKFDLTPTDSLLELSAGWQQRVAIAAALASGSKVILLDEPFSALDQAGSTLLVDTLEKLKTAGVTIVIAEHRTFELLQLADQFLQLSNGNLTAKKPRPVKLVSATPTKGAVRVLLGANGSGKTTFLNQQAQTRGVLVPQPASDLLFLDTVAAELSQSDKDAKVGDGTTQSLFSSFVASFDESQNPRDLSEGQKLALAISIQLARQTELLMLDEPTLGFDLASRQNLVNQLSRIAEMGVEVLVATHDQEFAVAIASETIAIERAVELAKQ